VNCLVVKAATGFLSIVLLLPVWVTSLNAGVDCPSIELRCETDSDIRFEPQGEISCSDISGASDATYDLKAGTFSASAVSGFSAFASVLAEDEYTITGVAVETEITFQARLWVVASGCFLNPNCCGGGGSATIQDGDGNSATVSDDSYMNCNTNEDWAAITITRRVGTPFRLFFYVTASGVEGGDGEVCATLSFSDLPPGSLVTSCHGFMQDIPTQVARKTWGMIKSNYR
jgi:hypothetical protein